MFYSSSSCCCLPFDDNDDDDDVIHLSFAIIDVIYSNCCCSCCYLFIEILSDFYHYYQIYVWIYMKAILFIIILFIYLNLFLRIVYIHIRIEGNKHIHMYVCMRVLIYAYVNRLSWTIYFSICFLVLQFSNRWGHDVGCHIDRFRHSFSFRFGIFHSFILFVFVVEWRKQFGIVWNSNKRTCDWLIS